MIRISETQKDRFSISDDIRSKVLTVRISDVREDDGGVYYCGVGRGGGESVSYHSLYSEIQLQVTASTGVTRGLAIAPGHSFRAAVSHTNDASALSLPQSVWPTVFSVSVAVFTVIKRQYRQPFAPIT
ncbi:hypothetical protein MHYP_G00104610 [Metynnis hypsauchen]